MSMFEQEVINKSSKNGENAPRNLASYLKTNFGTYKITNSWKQEPIRFIFVDGKSYQIDKNKKHLINRIMNEIKDDWFHLDENTKKLTVKKFLEGIS